MHNDERGFTLIELLVVIAIIGILSAVVLASLSTARSKGNDAGVMANIDSVVTQAAIYQDTNNQDYGTLDDGSGGETACPAPGMTGATVFNDPTIESAIAEAVIDSAGGNSFCYANGTTYAVAVSRPIGVVATQSVFWCADSAGEKCATDGNNGDGKTPIINGVCASAPGDTNGCP
jgi:prepilin-type N-terminal cleavage/methylation domain-containing protein